MNSQYIFNYNTTSSVYNTIEINVSFTCKKMLTNNESHSIFSLLVEYYHESEEIRKLAKKNITVTHGFHKKRLNGHRYFNVKLANNNYICYVDDEFSKILDFTLLEV